MRIAEKASEYAYNECLHHLYNAADSRLFFVHGTTVELFDAAAGIQPLGHGDFGCGFYTYAATGPEGQFGIEKAAEWSRIKSSCAETPCLVYVSIERSRFISLQIEAYDRVTCAAAYTQLDGDALAGKPLVVGPVARRDDFGRKTPDGSLPCQFKLEPSGIAFLRLEQIIPLD